MIRKIKFGILIILTIGILWILSTTSAYSYPVPPLPDDNLIVNPWFRSNADPTSPGLDAWVSVLQNGIGWGTSQKASNPTSDIISSGRCGFNEDYCGTAARWANDPTEQENFTFPGLDVYLYQVVKANPNERKLKYFMYWVNHKVDVVEVKIYGGESPEGQWTEVWLPFSLSQDKNPPPGSAPGRGDLPWFQTNILGTILGEGYPYYKIELHARYPEPNTRQGDVGVKITGVYFATENTNEPESLSTPVFVYNPTVSALLIEEEQLPTSTPTPTATHYFDTSPTQASPTQDQPEQVTQFPLLETPQKVRTPSSTPPIEQVSTSEQQRIQEISPTQTQNLSDHEETIGDEQNGFTQGGFDIGFVLGLITAGLIVVIFLVVRWWPRKINL